MRRGLLALSGILVILAVVMVVTATRVQAQTVEHNPAGEVAGATTTAPIYWSVPVFDTQAWSQFAMQLVWYRLRLESAVEFTQHLTIKASYGSQSGTAMLKSQGVIEPAHPTKTTWHSDLHHQGHLDWQAARLDIDGLTRQAQDQTYLRLTAFPPIGDYDSRPWLNQWWVLPSEDVQRGAGFASQLWSTLDQGLTWRTPEIRWQDKDVLWPFQVRLGAAQLAEHSWWLPPDCTKFRGQGMITLRWGSFWPQAYQFDGACLNDAQVTVGEISVLGKFNPADDAAEITPPPEAQPWQQALDVPQARPAELPVGRPTRPVRPSAPPTL